MEDEPINLIGWDTIVNSPSFILLTSIFQGLEAFGENTLKAVELNTAIKEMHAAKKYNKMVFYVEACESGSMFKVSQR